MVMQYANYKESIIHAYYNNIKSPSPCAENNYYSLILEDDDKWQELVNYVYAEEKEEE